MADEIKLVKGDQRPYIKLTLTKSDGSVIDLSDPGTTVNIKFRPVNSESVLTTIPATKTNGGADGQVTFNFPGATLNVDPGYYEGEVVISFGSEKQTVWDRLKFLVRENFS